MCHQALCLRPVAMSLEVSGQPEGISLIQAIEAENIPLPEPMSFPKWQHWRKHEGRRPTKKKDGIACSTADEVKLWKEVMEFFHDIKSDEDDEEEEEEEEKDKDESLELAPDTGGVPALLPVPATASEALAAAAAKAAKGPAALEGAAPPCSGPPSSAGIAIPSADDLRKELFAVYRPDEEPLGQFLSRIGRLVLALKAHKISVAASDLEKISLKATILSEVYGRIGGDWDPKKLARALRLRFSNAAAVGAYDERLEDLAKETDCIAELILRRVRILTRLSVLLPTTCHMCQAC